uniref:Box A-binding factor isoform X2 n=1 Tax=Rhizophora mucronata TaxID=61149 RepID=A0A2P2MJR1_RHIMU
MTEQEISQALQSLLQDYSSTTAAAAAAPLTSLNAVVQHLEAKLGHDLSHKADFIRAQIQHFLFQPPSQHPHQKDHFAPQQQPPPPPTTTTPTTVAASAFASQAKPDTSAVSTDHTPKAKGPGKGKRRGGPGGLNKLCGVSPELQAIVGQPALPRTEIVKQLWAYIRKNNLQDPSNKRKIICNDELRLVFETDCTDMFRMNKLLAKHIIPLEPTKDSGSKKQKVDDGSGARQPVNAPSVAISEALASFFGVGFREMPQSEVFTRLWEYINVNHLEVA